MMIITHLKHFVQMIFAQKISKFQKIRGYFQVHKKIRTPDHLRKVRTFHIIIYSLTVTVSLVSSEAISESMEITASA